MNLGQFRIRFPFYKYISGILIVTLILSQTIHVSFFDRAEASPDKYRDIVSIFVDSDTYSQADTEIQAYSKNIETYLGGTRVSIFVLPTSTSPETIASRNEKLYYEGDDQSEVSRLVGTILIGNIPIPIVHNSDVAFPSLYPYVDFVDKQFAWNSRSDRYEYLPQADRKVVEPEIWHGVVNPAVGRDWNGESDIQKIKNFLKKTEDFYAGKGKFAPRSTPPRVFYYDGFAESKSVNTKNLFLYGLTMSNTENLAYKRFTKYLLQDLNGIVDQFNTTADADTKSIVAGLGITSSKDEIDANTVKIMPDVQSRLPIQSILKNFKSIINETTLADAYGFVRNAGRYSSGSSVRVDLSPISMTIADEVAQSTLKQTNIAIMSSIDQAILNSGIVRRIPIFDELHASYSDPINLATENLKSYSAFYLGQSSKSITTPQMCSFTRGSSGYVGTFGRSELVEANLGYDVSTTEKQLDVLKSDTQQLVAMKGQSYSCFDTSGSPKLDSYWGGNSILRVVNSSNPSELLNESPGATRIKGMTQSIVSIGGMKETTRLPAASIADCTNERYIYALRNPEILHVNVFNRLGGTQQCLVGVPSEWNTGIGACSGLVGNKTPRYTCISQNESLVNIPSFAESLDKFTHSTCLSGSVYLDGTSIQTANSICMNNAAEGTSATVNRGDDMTTYENIYFHTIPSILHHISPTDEELSAAIENGATPSIPVDMVRYLEFYTPKGNIARIDYPNFFTLSGTDIASLRASLKDLSEKTWQKIIDQENSTTLNPKDQIAQKFLLQGSPSISILDWNNYISDELLLKVLQSRNWLNPDVTVKYKQSIETTLSYSHEYPNSDVTKNPPKIPTLSDSYDIAYLGLTSFFPQSNTSSEADTITSDYNAKFAQIKALNYSEPSENLDDPYSSSSQCGSPDGVDLFQWPSAISCWVHSLSMPRISAGSCGPGTIGIEKASSAVTLPTGLLSDIQGIQDFYSGGQLVYNIERTNISFHDSITLQYNYRKNGIPLVLPEGSSIDIHILSGSTSDGKQIPVSEIHKYIDSAPNSSKITDGYAKFVLTAGEKSANIDVRASLSIHFPDGSESKIESGPLHLRISDEYVDINSRNGITIDSTGTGEVMLDFSVKNHSGSLSTLNYPLSIDIFDDVDGTHLSSGTVSQTSIYTLSSIYTKKIGNYRILVQDASGRAGEITLAVRSGVFSQVSFEPISRVVLKGAETYAALHLLDNLGNPIGPDLHSVDIETENGFIIAQDGTKKQTYHVDLMEPILPLRLSGLNTGDFHIKIKIDNVIVGVYSLLVVPSAQMRLIRSNQPSVDGGLQKMMIRIVDESGKTISGFNSFASLTLPDGAGSFDNNSIRIQDGISEEFAYISGTRSGVHMLQAQIPGIGVIDNIQFSVSPGTPLYINHREGPGEIVFSLRDRYGNQSTNTLTGMLKKNNLPESSIVFDQGIFKIQKKSGLYIVRSPELSKNNIQYTDNSGPHTISGISQYATYIQGNRESFDFLPDYNARYTVLAGGSFLRESEDILYNSTTGNSQSLAVSTLLEPSEQKNTLVSVFAGGGVSLGQSTTNSVQFSANLEQGYPVLTAIDTVTQSTLLRSLYRMQNANLMVCTSSDCSSSLAKNTIAISFNEDSPYRAIVENGVLRLYEGNTMYLDVRSDGKIHSSMNIKITPNIANSQKYLTFDVLIGSQSIGKMYYSMDPSLSVLSISDIFSGVPNTPIIDSTLGVQLESFSDQIFANNVQSYHVMGESTSDIDERKNGPSTIDSLGDLPDLPGVGWQGNNRTLLAYAGGDTVGESSRFFHTFTFINLGDPVAHVDKGATGTTIDGVDRTIGTQITSSNGEKVHSYLHKDMNADGYEDILVAYNDGYIELFQNLAGKFRSREKIAYIPDLLSRGFSLGDFQKDGYADIIGVNNSGSFILVDNTKRHFQTMSISSRSSVPTPTGVTQFKIYDMDNDGRDDIVYLTDSGNLGIMYATESSGIFDISLLDTTLGVNLVNSDQSIGGAIFANSVPQGIQKNSDTLTGSTDERMLTTEVFYPYSYIDDAEIISGQSSIDTLGTLSGLSQSTKIDTYVRSEYASAYGLEIGRSFKNLTNSIVHSGDRIRVDIAIKNTTSQDISNISYLEKIPTIFSANSNSRYSVMLDDTKIDRTFETITDSEYDARFIGRDIPAGKTIHIIYEVTALPASYGELLVGKFEGGEMGDDAYGDVGFKNSTTCGADMLIWRSQSTPHQYVRGTRTFTAPVLPDELKKLTQDSDGDGIPDRADVEYQDTNNDGQIDGVKKGISDPELKKVYQSAINNGQTSSASSLVHISKDKNGLSLDVGFDSSTMQDIDSMMDNLVSGLNCGFGGGGCMNFPMNWAPLAPGSAPVVFGYPVSTLTPSMGVPLFSFPTTLYTPLGPVPVLWPGSPFGAGGIFGYLPHPYQSLLRIYVTPTLTLGMGTAICFGPGYITGWLPPPGLSPLIPGGNCIVLTKSMPVCKADGSRADGDVSGFSGLGTMADTWNSQSCSLTANVTNTNQNTTLTRDIVAYLKDPRSHNLTHIYTAISQRGTRSKDIGTFMRIGGSESSSNTQVGITIDSAKPLTLGNIVNVHNKRIAAFPDFLMNWVTRQTEEITNALFNPPNLTIIPPTTLGQHATIDSSFSDFFQQFNEASIKQGYADFQKQTINAYSGTNILPSLNQKIQSKSSISASFAEQQKKLINSNSGILNSAQGGINAIRAGYTFIGKLPFVSIQEKMIPLNIPWILPQELDRYSRSLKAYEQEINETLDGWCRGKTPQACADLQTSIQSQSFINALRANMKRIEEYRNFPIKLQKYVTWKQRYMAQILCNIESIQKISSTWLKENGTRFRKWAELYVLLKAIADSWQPVVDILADTNASCGVCHNERYNAQYWKFKLLSAVIPSIPIIQFPRWPNIVLDLSDIRLGVSITVPNFQPRLSPIRLPELPNLSLPDAPNASLSLPSLPVLPPIPILPDLPDLPSFPTIHLPNLPSPPKVPKLMGSINGVLKIFKLVKKIYCYYQNTSLVPEWQAGDVIAQRTERQGTMSFDFLDVKYPQFSLPTVSDITVSSHVNFQLRSEFIAEFAQAAVKPLNQFTTDLTHTLPKKVGNDINIRTPVNDIKYQGFIQIDPLLSTLRTLIEARSVEEGKLVDSETFTSYFITQLETSGMHDLAMRTKQELKKVQIDQEKLTQNLILKNDAQFDILQKYINSQYSETAKIQNIIDTLMSPLSGDIVANFQYVSDSTQESSMYLDRYNSMIGTQNTEISPLQETNPLSMNITGNKLSKRMKQVADIVSPMVSDATSSPTSGYSPNFHGIYILTKRGEQTQLFDYSQNLTGDEKVEAIDIDKDGDMDYLYLLDGILYVKYTITQNPKKIIDTTINLIRIKDEYIPRSPNYFHENVISPELLSVTFMPSQSSERSWRMEFYNRYLEDDAIRLGINDSLNTPRQTVDIIARDTSLSQDLEVPVERSLLRVYDPDTMLFMSPKITFFTGAISFTLNVGRMIYTGEDSVLIKYGTGNGQFQEKKLQPHMGYHFPETYIIKKEKGNLYYIDEFGKQENYTYTDDLVGVPLLPGSQIKSSLGEIRIRDNIEKSIIVIPKNAIYALKNVGSPNDEYNFEINYPNGFYSARLYSITDSEAIRAGVTLLAPQISSDKSSPEIDLADTVKIPVYSMKQMPLKDIITESTHYTIMLDQDIDQDENHDGILDNDFMTFGTGFNISSSSLDFGPYNTLSKHHMKLRVTDEEGNFSEHDFTLEVYSPIPTIQSFTSSGMLQGGIDESIINEPINFFRVRHGSDIIKINSIPVLTESGGTFMSGSFNRGGGMVLNIGDTKIELSEDGLFHTIPNPYSLQVIGATSQSPMRIEVLDKERNPVYSTFFTVSTTTSIRDLAMLSGSITENTIGIQTFGRDLYIPATSTDPTLLGGGYIIDEDANSLVAIARDGNIYPLQSDITLKYKIKNDKMVIEIFRKNLSVGEITYNVSLFSSLK